MTDREEEDEEEVLLLQWLKCPWCGLLDGIFSPSSSSSSFQYQLEALLSSAEEMVLIVVVGWLTGWHFSTG